MADQHRRRAIAPVEGILPTSLVEQLLLAPSSSLPGLSPSSPSTATGTTGESSHAADDILNSSSGPKSSGIAVTVGQVKRMCELIVEGCGSTDGKQEAGSEEGKCTVTVSNSDYVALLNAVSEQNGAALTADGPLWRLPSLTNKSADTDAEGEEENDSNSSDQESGNKVTSSSKPKVHSAGNKTGTATTAIRYVCLGGIHGHLFPIAQLVLEHLEDCKLSDDACYSSRTGNHRSSPAGELSPLHFVFLGDYIDGGHYSRLTLAFLATLSLAGLATLLVGRHEALYPISTNITSVFGRLDAELTLAAVSSPKRSTMGARPVGPVQQQEENEGKVPAIDLAKSGDEGEEDRNKDQKKTADDEEEEEGKPMLMFSFEHLESVSKQFFLSLPLAAVVSEKYLCLCGGLTPQLSSLSAFEVANREQIVASVLSDPMDDDEEYQEEHNLVFATNQERPEGFIYSFDATCQLLHHTGLLTVIRNTPFTTTREVLGNNSCGRPWHYQHSPFDTGYRCYRKVPTSGFPSIISIFSAPEYCSVNSNRGACVILRSLPPPSSCSTLSKEGEGEETKPKPDAGRGNNNNNRVVEIRQFGSHGKSGLCSQSSNNSDEMSRNPRPTQQLPGPANNAFAWSLPMLVDHLRSAVEYIALPEEEDPPMPYTETDAKLLRFRRLCEMLKEKGELTHLPHATNIISRSL